MWLIVYLIGILCTIVFSMWSYWVSHNPLEGMDSNIAYGVTTLYLSIIWPIALAGVVLIMIISSPFEYMQYLKTKRKNKESE